MPANNSVTCLGLKQPICAFRFWVAAWGHAACTWKLSIMPGCSLKPLNVCAWPAVLRRVHCLIPPCHVCPRGGTQAHALHLSTPCSLRCHASKADWPPSPVSEAALQPGLYLVSLYELLSLIEHALVSLPLTANAELASDAGGHSHWESGGHHAEGSSCPEVGHRHAPHLAATTTLHVLTPGQTKACGASSLDAGLATLHA